MAYLALNNSWGEVACRNPSPPPLGPSPPTISGVYSSGLVQQSPYLFEQAYERAVQAAEVFVEPIEELVKRVKEEEYLTAVEPGVVVDVNLANVLCEIPEEAYTPIHSPHVVAGFGEEVRSGTETEVHGETPIHAEDVVIEPSPVSEAGYATEQSGAPLVEIAWPPPVLEDYPLHLVMQ